MTTPLILLPFACGAWFLSDRQYSDHGTASQREGEVWYRLVHASVEQTRVTELAR